MSVKRNYRAVADKYVVEWLMKTFPANTWRTNVILGEVDYPREWRLTREEYLTLKGPLSCKADAIVFLHDRTIIVEAKIRDDRGKIEQLLQYEYLFKRDPQFKDRWHLPVEKVLLTPKDFGYMEKWIESLGIKIVKYRPPWVETYLVTLPHYNQRGSGSQIRSFAMVKEPV